MTMIWLWAFVGINLLIRLPIGIAKRIFKVDNEKLDTIDFISSIAVGFCFVGMGISGIIAGEVDIGLAIACIILIGGITFFLFGVGVYVYIKEKREKKNDLMRISKQKNQYYNEKQVETLLKMQTHLKMQTSL